LGTTAARLRERANDVVSDMDLCDFGTDDGHDRRDLVAEHCGRRNEIVSGEQQVGVTQPGRLHIDVNFTSDRHGNVHILEVEPTTNCV
jgi:hypothetical protein